MSKLQLYKVRRDHHSPAPMISASAIDISINLLMVVHVVTSLLLILVVLMQRPKQEGLGAAFGGGMMDSFAGAGTTSFLQKSTVYMGSLFIILSLALAILIGNRNHQEGLVTTPAPEVSADSAPEVPELPEPSLMEELGVEAPAGETTTPESAESEGETPDAGTSEAPATDEPKAAEDAVEEVKEAATEAAEETKAALEEAVEQTVDPDSEISKDLEEDPAMPQ